MTAVSKSRLSFKDYIAFEEEQELRHEFEDGVVFARAGGSLEHGALVLKVAATMLAAVGDRCRTFSENVRVRSPSGKVSYPDVFVVCGPIARDPEEEKGTITNPRLIIEVLSETTEAYDRGKKFVHYRSCESFLEYVVVASQEEPYIERYLKVDGVWTLGPPVGPGEQLRLASVDVTLDVDAIYAGLVHDGVVRVI